MDLKDIENVVNSLRGSLYPSLGDMSGYEVYHQKRSIFSETAKVRLHFGRATKNIVLKESRRDPSEESRDRRAVEVEFDTLRALHDKFSECEGLNVVRPLACLPDNDILVLEEFAGNQLNTVIVDKLRWRPSERVRKQLGGYFTLCGTWLRLFQQFTKEDETIAFAGAAYLERVESLFVAVEWCGIGDQLKERILEFAGAKCEQISERQVEMAGYHSDFTPWNILVDDDQIAVMDFGQSSRSTTYDDLTLFLATLEGYKSVVGINDANISHMSSAFLDGYRTSTLDPDLFDLLLLKNTLKTIWMMGYSTLEKAGVIDRIYRDYRKRKQLGVHLSRLEQLTS